MTRTCSARSVEAVTAAIAAAAAAAHPFPAAVSVDDLSAASGYSRRAVQYALREVRTAGRVRCIGLQLGTGVALWVLT